MLELAQLFSDVEAAVISDEDAVEDIESKTELIVEHVTKGNKELDGGIKAAYSRNRKKWYCLGALGEFFFSLPPSPLHPFLEMGGGFLLFFSPLFPSPPPWEVGLTNLLVVLILIIVLIVVIITQVVKK